MAIAHLDDLLATVEQLPEPKAQEVLDFAQFLLHKARTSEQPDIEVAHTRSGKRAMIPGTRVPVSTIVGYIRLGETPESIADHVLPFLTRTQVHTALGYYYDHQAEIDRELVENTESASRTRLRERLGDEDFYRLTGESE